MFRDPIFEDKKEEAELEKQVSDVSAYLGNREILQIPIYSNSSSQFSAIK